MKSQINLVNQLQELVFTRDERRQAGDLAHLDMLDGAINTLTDKLNPPVKGLYQRLTKKDHVVMAPVVNGVCAVCGMRLPSAQMQQVRLAKTIQTCSNCGRMLCWVDEDAPRAVPMTREQVRATARKTGISRFSAEELMVVDLQSDKPEGAIRELADLMEKNKFINGASGLVASAMERESVLSTALGNGLAFPHVRGVEGGGLTLALGVSRKGIVWDVSGEKVSVVFFSAIPSAVCAFYLRLMAGLAESFKNHSAVEAVCAAKTSADLWKAFIKVTRHAIP